MMTVKLIELKRGTVTLLVSKFVGEGQADQEVETSARGSECVGRSVEGLPNSNGLNSEGVARKASDANQAKEEKEE